jgi:hypothetical protein
MYVNLPAYKNEEHVAIGHSLGEPGRYYAKGSKPGREREIVYTPCKI